MHKKVRKNIEDKFNTNSRLASDILIALDLTNKSSYQDLNIKLDEMFDEMIESDENNNETP